MPTDDSSQGTILDRIDFNVEHAAMKVEDGARQLKKADHYHRKNRNMKCILGLSGTIIILIFILVIAKAKWARNVCKGVHRHIIYFIYPVVHSLFIVMCLW